MDQLVKAIDRAVQAHHNEARRRYLGASSLGTACVREAWYGFRWAYKVNHTGRLLRLFNRGHEEEARFARWLRMAGCEVREHTQRLMYHHETNEYALWEWDRGCDPQCQYEMHLIDVHDVPQHITLADEEHSVTAKQYGFVDHNGHFAGHSDGMIRGGFLEKELGLTGWGLVEYKTHGDKSFKLLQAKGVVSSKMTHYVQMQIYMHYMKLPWALYVAVNKNDDHLYLELIQYKEEVALSYVDRAAGIIAQRTAPPRISNDASWFACKFCDFRQICHHGEAPQKNCRSCAFAEPTTNGEWQCGKYAMQIPRDFIPKGCDQWEAIVE